MIFPCLLLLILPVCVKLWPWAHAKNLWNHQDTSGKRLGSTSWWCPWSAHQWRRGDVGAAQGGGMCGDTWFQCGRIGTADVCLTSFLLEHKACHMSWSMFSRFISTYHTTIMNSHLCATVDMPDPYGRRLSRAFSQCFSLSNLGVPPERLWLGVELWWRWGDQGERMIGPMGFMLPLLWIQIVISTEPNETDVFRVAMLCKFWKRKHRRSARPSSCQRLAVKDQRHAKIPEAEIEHWRSYHELSTLCLQLYIFIYIYLYVNRYIYIRMQINR